MILVVILLRRLGDVFGPWGARWHRPTRRRGYRASRSRVVRLGGIRLLVGLLLGVCLLRWIGLGLLGIGLGRRGRLRWVRPTPGRRLSRTLLLGGLAVILILSNRRLGLLVRSVGLLVRTPFSRPSPMGAP